MNGLLFIDDEEGIRHSVSRALRRTVYAVQTATSGKQGLALLKKTPDRISIVIADYKMPGLNGLETLAEIHAINPEIIRILLTGYATMDVAIAATNEGIDGFLTKPFDNIEFRANIHDICLRKRLRQFVSDPVYQLIRQSPDALQPTFHEATVLFADIRNFTRMSIGTSPEQIAAFLNDRFFAPMGEIAFRYTGTVDKHIGDSVMVVFGAPVADAADPGKAVQAAITMQRHAQEIDRVLQQENGLRLHIGIGIATGNVFSGVLGSLRKKEFTSVGMAVNMASRLQDMAAGGDILISEKTYLKMKQPVPSGEDGAQPPLAAHPLPPVNIKGIDDPITIYKVDYGLDCESPGVS